MSLRAQRFWARLSRFAFAVSLIVPGVSGCVPEFEPIRDLLPLEVVSVAPVHGATDVPLDAVVRVEFSKPLLAESVNPQTLRVSVVGGDPVAGSLALSEDAQRVTFTPAADWHEGLFYQVTVTRGIQDSEGQPLWLDGEDRVSLVQFRAFVSVPFVVSVTPADGSPDVSDSLSRVSVVFSEAMDPTTLHPGSFFLYDVQGEVVYDAAGLSADFVLHAPLVPHRTYRGLVTTRVRDAAGIPLEAPVPFSFHVLPAGANDNDDDHDGLPGEDDAA